MKGQSKRFVSHKGNAYDLRPPRTGSDDIGFFDLWRYASGAERAATAAGVVLAWCCSAGMVAAVLIYGELTSLFVQRHTAAATTPHAHILTLFGGGAQLARGNRSLHMEALVQDSVAFGLASLVIMALQLAAAAAAVTLANWAASRMVTRLRIRLLSSVISQEIAFFDTNTTMNFSSVLTEDMEKLQAGTGEHVVMTSYLMGTVLFGAGLALCYGWELTLVGLSVVPVAILVAALVAKYQTKLSAKEVVAYGRAGRIVEEVLSAIRTVRAYGGEDLEVQRYESALRDARRHARARGACAGAGAGLGWLLTYSLNAIIFGYGAMLCVRDMELPPDQQHYHPGVMVTVLFCSFIAAQNISMCQPHLEIFSSARGAAKSLFQLLERKSQINALEDKGIKPDSFRGDISFENVYFNYPSRPDVKVVRGLTLRVRAGETVALVGASGCGKSTLLQLLQRAYEPDSGRIALDEHPLPSLHLHHYRRSIGVVGQEPVLFSGTIRENITFGMENVSEEELVAAARTANAHHFITKLANGYATELGERGATLSGGQRQRVALARALVRSPALLLLDEPTAALDPAAERQVQSALDAASKGRTTLVVSHRLSTIVNADRIVYMEQGSVLEQGSHAELLERRGHYWKLVNEDLTTKSIASALSSTPAQDEDDEVEDVEPAVLRRSSVRRSVSRTSVSRTESMSRERVLRDSRRAGSASSVHVPVAAVPDLINYQEPEETLAEESEPAVSTWALLKLNREEWPLLAAGGLASFLIGATMPIFAFLFSKLYGMFAWGDGERILEESRVYAGAFAGTAALCGLVTFLQAWLFNLAGSRLTDRLRVNCFRNYLAQEQGWFDSESNAVGALCARLGSDCAAVQGATGTRLGTVLQGVSTMVIGVSLAMIYSWKMTLVSLLSVPCVMGGIYLEGYVNKRAEVRGRRALEQASRVATEALLNIRTVQSLGVERVLVARYGAALAESSRAGAGVRRVRGGVYGLCLCAPTLGYAVSLAYGGYLIAAEGLSYEYTILVSEALIYGAWMLAEALSFAPNFAAARRSGGRILQALARSPLVVSEPGAKRDPAWVAAGEVKAEGVEFSYPSRPGSRVLRGLSLRVRAGETVALVGASGCGKSTLMQLLLRNYDPQRGHLELDSRDTRRDVALETLRAQLGLVQQEPVLFERSLRDNIAYGDTARAVPLEDIISAAQQANLHDFIAGLPLGYETVVGQGGASLSGGQKQRVAIARALVRKPRVLLLDEATSALDAASEKGVQTALEHASRGRTTIIIAHRLATVRHAHTICVLDRGVVAESGTHEELVQRRGLYWELLHQQAPAAATA